MSEPDDASQCSSMELGVERLEAIYADHLEAQKNPPAAPQVAPEEEDAPDSDDLPF